MAVTSAHPEPSKEAALAALDKSGIEPRQRYRHYENQRIYTVVAIGIAKADLEPTVAYAGPDGIVWFTPLQRFAGRAFQDGTLVQRFVRVED